MDVPGRGFVVVVAGGPVIVKVAVAVPLPAGPPLPEHVKVAW
ncbi:hypothetical protein [Amycolatopsis thermoflava]